MGAPSNKFKKFIEKINDLLNKIPDEERHNANYFFIRGLFYKMLGNCPKATTYFKNAAVVDPGLIDAGQELQ